MFTRRRRCKALNRPVVPRQHAPIERQGPCRSKSVCEHTRARPDSRGDRRAGSCRKDVWKGRMALNAWRPRHDVRVQEAGAPVAPEIASRVEGRRRLVEDD